jgi:hypothetical protein
MPLINPTFTPVYAHYNGTATGTLSGSFNVATFPTKIADSANAYSAGTFTVPATGVYSIAAHVDVSGTYALNGAVGIAIYVNGSVLQTAYDISGGAQVEVAVSASIAATPLSVNDAVTIQVSTSASGPSYTAGAQYHWFSIARVA